MKHNLWRDNSAVVFVGYQGAGTLGRRLLDGVESVRLFGEEIAVRAKIVNFQGLSSHADHDHLLSWIESYDPRPARVFVVHGDADVIPVFSAELETRGFATYAPLYTASYDLAADRELEHGYQPEKKRTAAATLADDLYSKLLAAAEALLELVRSKKGAPNKEKKAFTRQILDLIEARR